MLSCTGTYLPCIITINVLTLFFYSIIYNALTCALIITSWYIKMVKMCIIKLTEHVQIELDIALYCIQERTKRTNYNQAMRACVILLYNLLQVNTVSFVLLTCPQLNLYYIYNYNTRIIMNIYQ